MYEVNSECVQEQEVTSGLQPCVGCELIDLTNTLEDYLGRTLVSGCRFPTILFQSC